MGLIIRPKSKLRALQCRIYSWEAMKMVFRGEPIYIDWDSISEILIIPHHSNPHFYMHYVTAEGFTSSLNFYEDEVANIPEFESYLSNNQQKVRQNRFSYFSEHMAEQVGPYLKYGAISTKYVVGLMALTFMFFQSKYFGSWLIEKYQFLIKASCNQQCAEELWTISMVWFYVIVAILSPIIPVLFLKKIYASVLRSKNVHVINGTLNETFLLAAIGLTLLIATSPKIWDSTSRYSKILVSYTDNSLETKLSQKVEMASKRKFEGDTEEIEFYQDPRAEP